MECVVNVQAMDALGYLGTQAPSLEYPRSKVLHDHVHTVGKLSHHLPALIRSQVDGDAPSITALLCTCLYCALVVIVYSHT